MDDKQIDSKLASLSESNQAQLSKKSNILYYVDFVLLFTLVFSLGMNQIFINEINKGMGINDMLAKTMNGKINFGLLASGSNIELSGDIAKDAAKLVLSSGTPDVYGAELNISFDKVQPALDVMKQYDPYDFKQGGKRIILTGDNLKRYISIGSKIACEYCCGVKTLVNADGKAACGCAHSMAMRGLAAYLIEKHGSEYTDDQILRELARWKGMYFPKQMIQKMAESIQKGNYAPDTAALVMGMKLPDYGKDGNATTPPPVPSDIKDLPNMVGGC